MNLKPRGVIVAVCLLCLFGSTISAGADPGRPGVRRAKGITVQKRREIISSLNLNDSQRQAFRQRKAAYRKRNVELKNDIALKSVERDNEIEKTNPDKEKVRRLTDEIGALKNQRVQEGNNLQADFEKLLTPAQLEKWRGVIKEHASTSADLDAAAE
jgi:Spy/CpxP family protein refolding chaperone